MLLGIVTAAPVVAKPKPEYRNADANVTVSGGQAVALNQCINNAQSGTITQINICNQIATSGNVLILENVTINIYNRKSPKRAVFSKKRGTLQVTGGMATAINTCVNDARDGIITQTNACTQAASAGNLVNLSGVSVVVP
jgi:hypothetical protein